MKILFLDFDGVLNWSDFIYKKDPEYIEHNLRIDHRAKQISRSRVQLLNQLVDQFPDLLFVVSSSWRKNNTLDNLQKILEFHGFRGTLLDITPSLAERRGQEIKRWLDTKPPQFNFVVDKFVILDDDSDMEPIMEHLVKTSFWNNGLQQNHIDEIIKRLS